MARYLSSGDLLGDPNSLPTGVVPMGTHAYTFDPIPASVVDNINKAQAIVMVVDKYTGDILNAKKISLDPAATSINGLQQEVDLEVFPNPAKDLVNFSFDTEATLPTVSLVLHDIHGKEVKRVVSSGNQDKVTLATEGLMDGMYFVHLVSEGRTLAVKKLLIAR